MTDIFHAAIRLAGSKMKSAGRVEVLHGTGNQKKWGTICGYQFDIKAAQVVCKELGYKGAQLVVPCCDVFGKGTGHIWMENVKCLGREPSITMCPHSGWGKTHCSHDQDVGVICETKDTNKTGMVSQGVNYNMLVLICSCIEPVDSIPGFFQKTGIFLAI